MGLALDLIISQLTVHVVKMGRPVKDQLSAIVAPRVDIVAQQLVTVQLGVRRVLGLVLDLITSQLTVHVEAKMVTRRVLDLGSENAVPVRDTVVTPRYIAE